jgi:hypothetical protein
LFRCTPLCGIVAGTTISHAAKIAAKMLPDDIFRSRLQSTITALRYWAPSIADAARLDETEASDYWRLTVKPKVASAC